MKKFLTLALAFVCLSVLSGLGLAHRKDDTKTRAVTTAKTSKTQNERTPATGDNLSTSGSSLTTAQREADTWAKDGSTVRLSTSSDNVGIGTTKPTAKLDVAGVIHASDAVTVGNSVGLLSSGSLNLIEVDNSNPLVIGFSNPMTATPSPVPFASIRVGIGILSPTNTLDVNGQARIRVMTTNSSLNDVVVADPSGVLFRRPASTLGGGPSWLLAGNALTTGTEFLGTTTFFPLRLFTNNLEKMRIDPNGNVGIATTSPTQKVTLGSGNILLPNANGGADGNLYFGGITDSLQTGMRMFDLVNSSFASGFIDVRVNPTNLLDGLILRVDSNNGGTERMRITASGRVGIGTTAPADTLSVGNNSPFRVNSAGDITRINGVTYAWPTSSANGVLTNTAGVLTWAPAAAGVVTGTCPVPNFVTKWLTASVVTCSQIFDNGNVGIGTTTPNQQLEITKNFRLPPTAVSGTAGVIMSGGNPYIHNFGSSNFFAGVNAGNMSATLTGFGTTGVGVSALQSLTSGTVNTAVGFNALHSDTTGDANTAVGNNALASNTIGARNTGVGVNALQSTTGTGNTAVGQGALVFHTTGSNNTALGAAAGQSLVNGSNNLYVANSGASAESGVIRIGTQGLQTGTFIAGIWPNLLGPAANVVVTSQGQVGIASSSRRFKEHINDMGAASEVLYRLRPVSFLYKPEYGGRPDLPQFGLIAEEVAKLAPELVAYDEQGQPYTVNYQFLAPMLLNELQKKNTEIKNLLVRLDALETLVEGLTKK